MNASKRRTLVLTAVAGTLLGGPLCGPALAMFLQPTDAPIERLIENLGKALKEKPNDADLHYRLARVHSLAFTHGSVSVRLHGADDPIDARGQPKAEKPLTDDERAKHLKLSIEHYYRAIALTPGRPGPRLGLASLLETALPLAGTCDANPSPPIKSAATEASRKQYQEQIDLLPGEDAESRLLSFLGVECAGFGYSTREWASSASAALLERRNEKDPARREAIRSLIRRDWMSRIEMLYFQAFARALDTESGAATQPMQGPYVDHPLDQLVSYEAATAFVRLVEARGANECDAVRLATAKAAIKAYAALPQSNAITPIIFPTGDTRSLTSLSDPSARVGFDLDGTGRPTLWSWVQKDAAILVWDPTNSGKITSGRQLFGSVSWWIFFENGYDALDALDDNRDGQLTGEELKGIAVWVDRNGNGVSDPGEVTPIEQCGVRSIRVHATSTEDGCPANHDGLVMADGRVLPTYDWIATPATPKRTAAPRVTVAGFPLWIMAGAPVALLLGSRRRRIR